MIEESKEKIGSQNNSDKAQSAREVKLIGQNQQENTKKEVTIEIEKLMDPKEVGLSPVSSANSLHSKRCKKASPTNKGGPVGKKF